MEMTQSRRTFLAASAAAVGVITVLPWNAKAAGHSANVFSTDAGDITIHPVSHASFVMETPVGTIYVDPVGEQPAHPAAEQRVRREVADGLDRGASVAGFGDLAVPVAVPGQQSLLEGELPLVVVGAHEVGLYEGKSLASVDGDLRLLSAPVRHEDRRWLVPVDGVPRLLEPLLGQPVELPDNGAFMKPLASPGASSPVVVTASYDVSATGRVRNLEASADSEEGQSQASKVRRYLSKTRFRPRYLSGQGEEVDGVRREYVLLQP